MRASKVVEVRISRIPLPAMVAEQRDQVRWAIRMVQEMPNVERALFLAKHNIPANLVEVR